MESKNYIKPELLDLVMEEVVGSTDASKEEILGHSRIRYIDTARKFFLHISYNTLIPRPTHTELGTYINKDHATVTTSLKKTRNLIETEERMKETVQRIQVSVLNKLISLTK